MFQGGRHIDYVVEQIVAKLIEVVKKKNKAGVSVKPFQVIRQEFKKLKFVDLPLKELKLLLYRMPGEESHLGFCECTDRESNVRLSDQGEHDAADQELWVQVPSL